MGVLAYFQLILFCICMTALGACEVGGGVEATVAAARKRNDAPPIWIVKDADSTLYLFGTVHLIPPELDWQKKDMRNAFASAGTVFFEVPSGDKARLEASILTKSLGFFTPAERLSDRLDHYQITLLEAAAHNSHTDVVTLNMMQPWLASEFLTLAAATEAGLSAEISADEALKHQARLQKKNMRFFETVEAQIKLSARQPESIQMTILTETLIHFNTLGEDMKRIAQAWAVGNVDFLETEITDVLKLKSPKFYESVFLNRNAAWGDVLERYMQKSGTGFAAVGIGHLLGEASLQVNLRQRGYNVRRYYAFQGKPVIRPMFPNNEN